MKAPILTLKKQEIVWLAKHRCIHNHTLLEHYSCVKNRQKEDRIGFIDIESSSLKADYGIILCYCIKDNNSGKIYQDAINKDDIRKWGREAKEDTRVIRNLIKDMSNFDILVGHFSSLFDLPFIRTRAVMCGVEYPGYGVYKQQDTWRILRNKFNLSRNTLEGGTRNLVGKTRKNHLSMKLNHGCLRGERWALEEILEHCRRDVRDTQDLFRIINPFVKKTSTSI